MKVFLGIIGSIVGLAIVIGLCFGFGFLNVGYHATVDKAYQNADRQVFEQTASYVKGMADDLAKYKYEFETEKDETAKKAILNMIRSRFADFDADKLQDMGLRSFLLNIRNGKYDVEVNK